MTVLLVAAGAVVGAPLRYLTDRWMGVGRTMPWGTLAVNVVGSFLLGWLTSAAVAPDLQVLLGVGFCGALTTYSTFSYETLQLLIADRAGRALVNVALNLLLGGAAVALGWWLGS
jgi:fluoride exporter